MKQIRDFFISLFFISTAAQSKLLCPNVAQRIADNATLSAEDVVELAPHMENKVNQYLQETGYKFHCSKFVGGKAEAVSTGELIKETLEKEIGKRSSIQGSIYTVVDRVVDNLSFREGGRLSGYTQESIRETLVERVKSGRNPEYLWGN